MAMGGEPDEVFITPYKKTLIHLISQLSLTASPRGEATRRGGNGATDNGKDVNCAVTVTECRPRRTHGWRGNGGFVGSLVTGLLQWMYRYGAKAP